MYENSRVNPFISGVHVWKWHGEPSWIRRACMKMSTIRKDTVTIHLKVQSTTMEAGKIITSDKL